jgi:50S ribosomal subunit-associated GTPase HflX
MKGARCVVCALVSGRQQEPEKILDMMEATVKEAGGVNVGRLLQRRGVSRSRKPGGAGRMDQPLTQRTLFGKGKLEELVSQARSSDADLLFIHNSLTNAQRKALAELTDCRVLSFQDDVAPHLGPKDS